MSSKPKLLSLDAFSKTVEDARIKTTSGGVITLICICIVMFLIRNEYNDYTSIITRPELVVDKDINKKLDINLDISFPNLPCDVLTLDILDITEELQVDILKSGFEKFRIVDGEEILDSSPLMGNEMSLLEMAKGLKQGEQGECGSCYGALPQDNNEYCCNDCETVRLAYAAKTWGFYDGSNIEQCEKEGYVQRLKERIDRNEGCRIKGTSQINRVSGNMHFAPGASLTNYERHSHDLSLYQKYTEKFNFDHIVNHLSFGSHSNEGRLLLKSTHTLDQHEEKLNHKYHVFNYYLKVVATRFEFLNSEPIESNQYSVIEHDRPLAGGKDSDHQHTLHARGGLPGVFFHFDISPMKIINKEQYAKTWSGFILGVVSSVAGVLMVGSLIDRSVWAAEKVLKGKKDL